MTQQEEKEIVLDETQLHAVNHAVLGQFSVITGGAGTGKTSIIKAIREKLIEGGEKVIMCAFAGKAAARLKQATESETSTIHSMLKFDGTKFNLKTLANQCVIIDEASMVESAVMAAIIKLNPKKIILVGDAAQLPPVGKGQPFHDIINLRPDVVIELITCYRNSAAVFDASIAIRNGKPVSHFERSESEVWAVAETGDDKQTHAIILEQVKANYFDFEKDIILCPKNGKVDIPASVRSLNADIARIVLPRPDGVRLAVGDRIINTKNLSEKDIWNGTTGSVHSIDEDDTIWMKLDEPIKDLAKSTSGKTYSKDMVQLTNAEAINLELAYVLTVHKSQGSQYRKVVFICLRRDAHSLLSRSLIYTAVTRTREECVVVGQKSAFERGCSNIKSKKTIIQQLASL
jgi:exodeoxyribonuclease V alpha subunit